MRATLVTIVFLLLLGSTRAQDHPGLILTRAGVEALRAARGKTPLLDQAIAQAKAKVDGEIKLGIAVPVPKDLAGGYTHERHKANFFTMQLAGVLFQITEDEQYAVYIRDMLLKYAALYPQVGQHPATRSYARGKFFWQCLNDANWLVYTSQAYDCIYDWLDAKTRKKLNRELFRPYAEYISLQNPQFFNRIHNHSTWGNAAVGMVGLVTDDQELLDWALQGLEQEVPKDFVKDNDGGAIQLENQKEAGFLAQLDHAFSPDGYYTEGPYYQRYAMYPFLIFAQALANKRPELNIMQYREGLLTKAVTALIEQTNAAGEFFPINDAQKGMSLHARELVTAISMAYHFGDQNPALLSLIEAQDRVPLNDAGLSAARAIARGEARPYALQSIELRDGANGDEGAIGILRKDDITLVMKYAKHGMGHGHFDRLSFLLYDGEREVIQDYGAARWVNIEHKDGGGYLKENHSWAKQTIAHNTLVIDRQSQHLGKVKQADQTHGEPYLFHTDNPDCQLVSARETHAYEGVALHRTMALMTVPELESPLVLDVYKVQAETAHEYMLPFYYQGELMQTSAAYRIPSALAPFGESHGYQHLWLEAEGELTQEPFSSTWYHEGRFASLTAAAQAGDQLYLARIGANDPHFNLRRDPALILARKDTGATVFAQLIELHGAYNPADEIPVNAFTQIKALEVLHDSADYTLLTFETKSGASYRFALAHQDAAAERSHTVHVADHTYSWQGPYLFEKEESRK